jgi:hypothetical protein
MTAIKTKPAPMLNKLPVAYVKTQIWAGEADYFVGSEPSNPSLGTGFRLGKWMYMTRDLAAARSYAHMVGQRVVMCEPFVGY